MKPFAAAFTAVAASSSRPRRVRPTLFAAGALGTTTLARAAGEHAPSSLPSLGAGGIAQAGFGLVLVVALVFLCAWLAKRFGIQRVASGQLVKVVGGASLGQRERVVVVEVAGGAWLVLGVAPGRVNTLHAISPEQVAQIRTQAPDASTPAALFAQKLRQSLRKDT